MKPLVIIKAGSTFPATKHKYGDFEDWIIDGCASSQELPDPDRISGVIITGSHAMVTDRVSWMLKLEAWIRNILEKISHYWVFVSAIRYWRKRWAA